MGVRRSPDLGGVMGQRTVRSLRCLFRVAAGPRVGYGHLMRMRALAECLEARAALSIRGGAAAQRAAVALGFRLATARDAMTRADVVVIDDPSVAHGREWVVRAQRAGTRAVSIHDGALACDADLIVCGSLDAALTRN